jgi:hypothetical protein
MKQQEVRRERLNFWIESSILPLIQRAAERPN